MFGYGMPGGNCFANYSGAGGGCAMPAAAHTAAPAKSASSYANNAGCGAGSIIPLFILVGLLALFIPGGFCFILLLILLLILTCCCGAGVGR